MMTTVSRYFLVILFITTAMVMYYSLTPYDVKTINSLFPHDGKFGGSLFGPSKLGVDVEEDNRFELLPSTNNANTNTQPEATASYNKVDITFGYFREESRRDNNLRKNDRLVAVSLGDFDGDLHIDVFAFDQSLRCQNLETVLEGLVGCPVIFINNGTGHFKEQLISVQITTNSLAPVQLLPSSPSSTKQNKFLRSNWIDYSGDIFEDLVVTTSHFILFFQNVALEDVKDGKWSSKQNNNHHDFWRRSNEVINTAIDNSKNEKIDFNVKNVREISKTKKMGSRLQYNLDRVLLLTQKLPVLEGHSGKPLWFDMNGDAILDLVLTSTEGIYILVPR